MRRSVAERLIDGFYKGWNAMHAIQMGLLDDGEIADTRMAMAEVGCEWQWRQTCSEWMGNRHSLVADKLWDGAPREVCVLMLMGARPDQRQRRPYKARKATVFIKARELTKKHDWHTVK